MEPDLGPRALPTSPTPDAAHHLGLGSCRPRRQQPPPILPPSCPPCPPSAPQDQEVTFPGLPAAARTTRHLTWVSWISSLCPPSRAWVLCARARGCPSLCQVTVGSGSESASQLRTALSPAFTRTTPWGPLEACLKVGGTGEGDELSEGRGLPRVLPGPSRRLTAYGETRSRSGPRRRGWHRPRELEEEKPGQHAKGPLGDLGKASCPLWVQPPSRGRCYDNPPRLFPTQGRPQLG